MENRIRDQVESFVAYGGYREGMSVGEILAGARADRLVLKELEKNVSGIVADLVSGKAANTLMSVPDVDWQHEKYHIRGEKAVDIAKQVEQSLKITVV